MVHPLYSMKGVLKQLDGLLISKPANVSYLSGFKGGDSYILTTRNGNFFITDFRYLEQARAELKGLKRIGLFGGRDRTLNIELVNAGTFESIAKLIKGQGLKRVGFEAKWMAYGELEQIRGHLKKSELIPVYDAVEELRIAKRAEEIKLLRKAINITISAFRHILKGVRPGVKEAEVAAQLEYYMRVGGASAAFPTIVASGKRSSLPHASASNKKLESGELVVIDAGGCFEGYNSDLTRTIYLGKISNAARKIYEVVLEAQGRAIAAIKPGVKASYLDKIARDYINKKGYGPCFGHNLGHGVGMEVHEEPTISRKNVQTLRPGMVFTVEPAIYIPGLGGVRIEDVVLVTEDGCEVLSQGL